MSLKVKISLSRWFWLASKAKHPPLQKEKTSLFILWNALPKGFLCSWINLHIWISISFSLPFSLFLSLSFSLSLFLLRGLNEHKSYIPSSFYVFVFEFWDRASSSCWVAQTGHQLIIFLPQPSRVVGLQAHTVTPGWEFFLL